MKVLLASDGSEYSEGAARFLTNLELSAADEITALHVISSVPFQDDRASYLANLAKIKQETGAKILDAVVDALKGTAAKISTALIVEFRDVMPRKPLDPITTRCALLSDAASTITLSGEPDPARLFTISAAS